MWERREDRPRKTVRMSRVTGDTTGREKGGTAPKPAIE